MFSEAEIRIWKNCRGLDEKLDGYLLGDGEPVHDLYGTE
jgi:hypothetical protein